MKIESIDFQILESEPVEPEWRPLRTMREYPGSHKVRFGHLFNEPNYAALGLIFRESFEHPVIEFKSDDGSASQEIIALLRYSIQTLSNYFTHALWYPKHVAWSRLMSKFARYLSDEEWIALSS